jgi:serine phosphatase RsbU (regulator of sigma subunit)
MPLASPVDGEAMLPVVREVLSGIPAGCTWLLPVIDANGTVIDFRLAAAGAAAQDIGGRSGDARLGATVAQLYPTVVGGPLWALYHQVFADGQPGKLTGFRYQEQRSGVAAQTLFDISVHRVCGGLLVWWQRLDEAQRRMEQTEFLGNLGWGEYDLVTGQVAWSPGMYRLFERDPAAGPLTRAEQAALIVAEDQQLREAAWQLLDTGMVSDLTIRVRVGEKIKHLRLLASTAHDAEGNPVKIYGVVQDVTAGEDSRSAVEKLRGELRTQELSMLAEHRLAGQLQQIIQPLPTGPFVLGRLQVLVRYLPAESTLQVGGDWYHTLALRDGRVVLAVGDAVGHGLGAATAMAHLRYSLEAWARIGIGDPRQLLTHLNDLCLQLGTTATTIVAIFDPSDLTLRWARAGHPLPLHSRDGLTTALSQAQGILLGAIPTAVYAEAQVSLRPDDLVVFFTDGLIERRDERTSEDSLQTLISALSAMTSTPEADTLGQLSDLVSRPSAFDDTCVLAIRALPPTAE